MRVPSLPVLAVLVLCACGSAQLEAKNYSQACTVATDCTAAFFGEGCAVCACANGAIAVSSKARYDADAKSAAAWCGPKQGVVCGACMFPEPDCVAGACVLKK